MTESAGAEVPMEEEPIEVKNATVCGTEDDKPVEAPKSPISVDFAEEEAKEMELTDSSPKVIWLWLKGLIMCD